MPPVPFRVRALYDYNSDYPDDLNFNAETAITVTSIEDDEWYSGNYTDSKTGEVRNGIFPQNFVEVINEPAIPANRPRPKKVVSAEQEEEKKNEVEQLTPEESEKEDEDAVERAKEEAKEESGKPDVISQYPLPSQETSSKQSIEKEKEIEEPKSEAKNTSESNITLPQQKSQPLSSASQEKTAIESSELQQEAPAAPSVQAKPKKNNAFFNKIAAFDNQNAAPILPTKKPKEESYVKKPFYGAGKSSYIPSGFGSRKKSAAPPPPSSISPSSSAHSSSQPSVPNVSAAVSATNDDDESAAIATGSVAPVESEEQDQPKLSLKERIALLRKRQEEEAEREAALAKKKLEKKKKKTPPAPASVPTSTASLPSNSDSASAPSPSQEAPSVPSIPSGGIPEVPHPQLSSSSEDALNNGDGVAEDSTLNGDQGVKDETGITEDAKKHQSQEAAKEQPETENEATSQNKDAKKAIEEEKEEKEEEEEEEEDPEEARRRALRERMAKLSGGAGMFGMMGMNPFGQSASSSKKKLISKPKLEKDDRANKEDEDEEKEDEEIPRAIPILPGLNTGQNQPPVPGIPIPGIPTPGSALNAADSELDEAVPSSTAKKEVPVPPQAKETEEQEDHEQNTTAKSQSNEVKSNSDISSNISEIKDELDTESFNSASEKDEEGEFDKGDNIGDANEGAPLFAVESKKSEATEIPAITDEDKLENSVEPSETPDRPGTSEAAQATAAASLAKTVKPLLNASYSDYPSAKQAKQQAEQQGHPVAIDKNKVTSDGETTGYEGDEDTELPIQHNDEQHQQHQGQVPHDAEISPVRKTSTGLSNASINRRSSNTSSTSKGAPPPIPSQAPPFIPPVPVPGIAHASTTGSAPSAPPPSLPSQQQQQQQHRPSAPSHAAPAPPSSAAPPIPPVPSVPAPVSRSYTLPESAERGSGGAPSSSSNKRDSIFNNSRQSIDSFRRASIDSYRSGDYVVERTRSNLLSASTTNNSNNNRDAHQVTPGANDNDIDVYESPDWWLKNELPPTLFAQVNKTLIFEVDESKLQKRKGVNLVVKDFYILFAFDYRQKLITVTFDEANTSNVSFQIIDIDPTAPQSRTNDDNSGLKLYQLAAKYNGHSVEEPQHAFVSKLFQEIPDILSPIGLESFGKLVYINESQKNINQVDEFQPGDVLRIAKAKFQGHNKLHQKIVYEVGVSLPLVAVITEFDNHKLKFRVLEKDPKNKNKVKAVSYKITDLLSGSIKVFRPVSRSFVGW